MKIITGFFTGNLLAMTLFDVLAIMLKMMFGIATTKM